MFMGPQIHSSSCPVFKPLLHCLVPNLPVAQCFPCQPLPCCQPSIPPAFLLACLPGCPASGSAWHGALGIRPVPPPLPSPASFLSYCHAWSVPGPPPSEASPDNYYFFSSTSPRCREKEAGWGGRSRSLVILWKKQRLAR